jgi:hypothetical protein
MKTLLAIMLMWTVFFVYACDKDEPQGYGEETYCNCGIVCEYGVDSENQCYWLLIENECSGSTKKFCVDQFVWSAYSQGDRICINDQSPW